MSSFFRDSNLFAPLNNKPLFKSISSNNNDGKSKILSNEHWKLNDKKSPKDFLNKKYVFGKNNKQNNSDEEYDADVNDNKENEDEEDVQNDNNESIDTNDYDVSDCVYEETANPSNNGDDGDEDEIKITEVRSLTVVHDSKKVDENDGDQPNTSNTFNNSVDDQDFNNHNSKNIGSNHDITKSNFSKTVTKVNNEQSDSISINYLLNTISHLSETNKELEKQIIDLKIENEKVTLSAEKKKESISALKHHMSKFKTILTNNNDEMIEMKSMMSELQSKNSNLSLDLNNTKKNILKENELLLSLKTIVSNMKSQIVSNEALIAQKNEKIENLKKRVDEFAGRLSEEKIRNIDLNKKLTESSQKYESEMFNLIKANNEKTQEILDKEETFQKELNKSTMFVTHLDFPLFISTKLELLY